MTVRDPGRKILDVDEVAAWRSRVQGTVVFTNGVFDLLHRGHVNLLVAARALGNALVVGLNSDNSVRRLKGEGRPIRTSDDRALVVAALEAVDVVALFEEDTPIELIRLLRPDVLVKGADYELQSVVGAADVIAAGGRVELIPLTPGQSTTRTVEMLRGKSAH
ncbi:MAG: D-glycero-beta-D-manno-heptose 1-phosphate adenylyltransferase [Gemmatimonadota bacterium]